MSMRKYFLLISSALCADAQVPEPVVSAENRPFVRWWWLGNAANEMEAKASSKSALSIIEADFNEPVK